jgi:hypothetical protein
MISIADTAIDLAGSGVGETTLSTSYRAQPSISIDISPVGVLHALLPKRHIQNAEFGRHLRNSAFPDHIVELLPGKHVPHE